MFLYKRKKKLAILKRDYGYDKGLLVISPRYAWIFELKTSYLNNNRQSRHTTFYLASIREKYLDDNRRGSIFENLTKRTAFWNHIDSRLALRKLPVELEAKIRQEINEFVPRPTEEDVAKERRLM